MLIIYKDIPTQGNPEELDIENINPYEEECKLFVESVNKGQENDLLSAQVAIDTITICLKTEEAFKKKKRSIYWIEYQIHCLTQHKRFLHYGTHPNPSLKLKASFMLEALYETGPV
jgi:hypothetical protein